MIFTAKKYERWSNSKTETVVMKLSLLMSQSAARVSDIHAVNDHLLLKLRCGL